MWAGKMSRVKPFWFWWEAFVQQICSREDKKKEMQWKDINRVLRTVFVSFVFQSCPLPLAVGGIFSSTAAQVLVLFVWTAVHHIRRWGHLWQKEEEEEDRGGQIYYGWKKEFILKQNLHCVTLVSFPFDDWDSCFCKAEFRVSNITTAAEKPQNTKLMQNKQNRQVGFLTESENLSLQTNLGCHNSINKVAE